MEKFTGKTLFIHESLVFLDQAQTRKIQMDYL